MRKWLRFILLTLSLATVFGCQDTAQVQYWDGTVPPVYFRPTSTSSLVVPFAYFPDDFSSFYSIVGGYDDELGYVVPVSYTTSKKVDRLRLWPIFHTRFPHRDKNPNAWRWDGEFFPLFKLYSPALNKPHEYGFLWPLNIYWDDPEDHYFAIAGYGEKKSPPGWNKSETTRNFLHVLWRSQRGEEKIVAEDTAPIRFSGYDFIFPCYYGHYERGKFYNDTAFYDRGSATAFPFYFRDWDNSGTTQTSDLMVLPFYSHTLETAGDTNVRHESRFIFPFYYGMKDAAPAQALDILFPFYGRYKTPQSDMMALLLGTWFESHTPVDDLYVALWMFMLRKDNESWRAGLFDQLFSYGIKGRPHLMLFFMDLLKERPRPPVAGKPPEQEPDTVINHSIPPFTISEKGRYVEYIGTDSAVRTEDFSLYPFFVKNYGQDGYECSSRGDTFVKVDQRVFSFLPFYRYSRDYSVNSPDCGFTSHFGPLGLYYGSSQISKGESFARILGLLTVQSDTAFNRSKTALLDFTTDDDFNYDYGKYTQLASIQRIDKTVEASALFSFFNYLNGPDKFRISLMDQFCIPFGYDCNKNDWDFSLLGWALHLQSKKGITGLRTFDAKLIESGTDTRVATLPKSKISMRTVEDYTWFFPFYGSSHETSVDSHGAYRKESICDFDIWGLLVSREHDSAIVYRKGSVGTINRSAFRILPFYAYTNKQSENHGFNGTEYYGPFALWYQSHDSRKYHAEYRLLWAFGLEDTDDFNKVSFIGDFFSIRTGTKAELSILWVPIYRYKE